jgi:Protein of unknown function (DUF3579)
LSNTHTISEAKQKFYIQGKTLDGSLFRPSDWVERLCGVMAQFGSTHTGHSLRQLAYSPYVQPAELNGIKSVLIDEAIANIEPKALDFLYNFAKDNKLPIIYVKDICT